MSTKKMYPTSRSGNIQTLNGVSKRPIEIAHLESSVGSSAAGSMCKLKAFYSFRADELVPDRRLVKCKEFSGVECWSRC